MQEFRFYKQNNKANEKAEAQQKGQQYLETHVSKELVDLSEDILLDTTLLNSFYDYRALLNFYWHNRVNLPTCDLIIKGQENKVPLITRSRIKQAAIPEGIQEYLLAYNDRYWMQAYGITPETDSAFADFKKMYFHSQYLPALNKNYNEWLALSHGKPAPDFKGTTLEGKEISLKDLKGKIIYIDVWATWCGPCREEIPASKELQKIFEGNDQVVFLNVSVDSRRSDWENFFKEDNSWKGAHINLLSGDTDKLYVTYKIHGVPTYMIIDQSGNIVSAKAPRPSTGKVAAEINKLLEQRI